MRPSRNQLLLQALASQRAWRSVVPRAADLTKLCFSATVLHRQCLQGFASASLRQKGTSKAAAGKRDDPQKFGHPARRATDCLLVANALCFAAQYLFKGRLVRWGIKDNAAIATGQWWRLLTSAFLHGNLIHFATNAYSLNNVGPIMERLAGSRRFLCIYALSAAGGCALSFFCSPSYSLGASGAIFGILGSLTVFLVRHRKQLGPAVADSTLRNLMQVFAINLVIGMTPGIDNWGHMGGLLGGAAAAWLLGPAWSLEGKRLLDRPPLGLLAAKPRQIS